MLHTVFSPRFIFLLVVTFLLAFVWGTYARAAPVEIRLCTGSDGGPYAVAGRLIASMAKNDPNITVTVVVDTGGTWANVQKTILGEECDAMIGQPDGAALLKRQNPGAATKMKPVADLHREYLHGLCSKESGVGDIGDLESNPKGNRYSIALGDAGSGAWLIWQNFVAEDADYGEVPVTTESGVIALASVASGTGTTCMLQPAALGNSIVQQADEMFGDGLVLVGVNDKDFNDAVDPQGKLLYEFSKIPSGTYPNNLQGWFSGKTTVTWLAKVYVNSDRLSADKPLSAFITAVARAKPAIQAKYGK